MSFIKHFNTAFFQDFKKWGNGSLLNIFFFFFLCYFLVGIFPFAPYEEDSLGVIMGSKRIIETGIFGAHDMSYGFQMQPGTYFWIVLLSKISGLSPLYSYSIVSAFFGVSFLFLSVFFLQKITTLSFSVCGLILLLFQETYSAWYYCNSAVIAGAFMMLGFYFLLRHNTVYYLLITGVCLGVAAWSRADILIIYPVSFFIIIAESWQERILKTAFLAIVTLIVIWLLYSLSKLSFWNLLYDMNVTKNNFNLAYNSKSTLGVFWSEAMRSYLGFFSILIIFLIITGSVLMVKNKLWLKLAVLLTPIFMFTVILKGNVTSSKHLYYLLPFLATPVLINFQYLKGFSKNGKRAFIFTAFSLFLVQYILGVQLFFNTHPYIGKSYASVSPAPTYLEIFKCKISKSRIDSAKLVIGGGMKLATADEMMLSSGMIFSPLMWNNLKKQCNFNIAGLKDFIGSFTEDSLKIFTTQGSNIYVSFILSDLNYLLKSRSEKVNVWEKTGRKIFVYYAFYPKKMDEYTRSMISNNLRGSIFVPYWDWEKYFVRNNSLKYSRINDITCFFNQ